MPLIRPHCPDPSCHKLLRMSPHDKRRPTTRYDDKLRCTLCGKYLPKAEAVTKLNGEWVPYLQALAAQTPLLPLQLVRVRD